MRLLCLLCCVSHTLCVQTSGYDRYESKQILDFVFTSLASCDSGPPPQKRVQLLPGQQRNTTAAAAASPSPGPSPMPGSTPVPKDVYWRDGQKYKSNHPPIYSNIHFPMMTYDSVANLFHYMEVRTGMSLYGKNLYLVGSGWGQTALNAFLNFGFTKVVGFEASKYAHAKSCDALAMMVEFDQNLTNPMAEKVPVQGGGKWVFNGTVKKKTETKTQKLLHDLGVYHSMARRGDVVSFRTGSPDPADSQDADVVIVRGMYTEQLWPYLEQMRAGTWLLMYDTLPKEQISGCGDQEGCFKLKFRHMPGLMHPPVHEIYAYEKQLGVMADTRNGTLVLPGNTSTDGEGELFNVSEKVEDYLSSVALLSSEPGVDSCALNPKLTKIGKYSQGVFDLIKTCDECITKGWGWCPETKTCGAYNGKTCSVEMEQAEKNRVQEQYDRMRSKASVETDCPIDWTSVARYSVDTPDFNKLRNCNACVSSGFGWCDESNKCGHYVNQDCTHSTSADEVPTEVFGLSSDIVSLAPEGEEKQTPKVQQPPRRRQSVEGKHGVVHMSAKDVSSLSAAEIKELREASTVMYTDPSCQEGDCCRHTFK